MSKLQKDFIPSGFFVLRSHLLPFEELLSWGEGLEAFAAINDPARLDTALASDRARLRERLKGVIERPEVREALFVASPSLDENLRHWLLDPDSEHGRKIELSLSKYFMRMSWRPTPFGLFAGCSVGTLGADTRLVIKDRKSYRRHTRLDMDYLYALTNSIEHEPSLRETILYAPNTSLYHSVGRFRYVESRLYGRTRSHHLVAVEDTDYLRATLERSRQGATISTLAGALADADTEVSLEEAQEYIEELIDNQVLVSDITPSLTGPDPMSDLLSQLRSRPAAAKVSDCLERVRASLESMDAVGLGLPSERYRAVAQLLQELPAKVEMPRLFQVDMIKPTAGAMIGHGLLAEIIKGVQILRQVGGSPRDDSLSRFRAAFIKRYGEGKQVSLAEALDEEYGIGFNPNNEVSAAASPLLNGLAFSTTSSEQSIPWSSGKAFLLQKTTDALIKGEMSIALQPADLEKLESRSPEQLPDSFAAMVTVVAQSEAVIAAGSFHVVLDIVSGPSGARLLARFCHADQTLREWVERHLRDEEALHPDALFAEIAHLPEERIGNVLLRPVLRDYEIPYLGRSGAAGDNQIPITDLYLSVNENRLILRSKRLGREVIPRLSSAHNYAIRSIGLYRFLCSLQSQATAKGFYWEWGVLENSPFLPRVTTGRLVLSRARWYLSNSEIKMLGKTRGKEQFQAVQRWRAERRLPRFVVFAERDNEMPIDLDNVISVEILLQLCKKRGEAVLFEMFPAPDELCVQSPEGHFMHELIIPFTRVRGNSDQESHVEVSGDPSPVTQTGPGIQRSFPPGSEWIYCKLYTGTSTADHILCDGVEPVIRKAMRSGAIDQWFFLRYGDPDWHLRLRLHGDAARLNADVLPELHLALSELLNNGLLYRIEFDTYEREVERYGGSEGIILSERIFHADSEAVLAIIEMLSGDEGADVRWQLAFRGIDMLLSDLGFNLDMKRDVIRQSRQTFGIEFHVDKTGLKHQLGRKFVRERKVLEALLAPAHDQQSLIEPGIAVLNRRSDKLTTIVAELRASQQVGRLLRPLLALAPNYTHMYINRLLPSALRAQELVLYDFLLRLYNSQAARKGQNQ